MPCPPRTDQVRQAVHALNRGNARQTVFHKDGDYEAFEWVLVEGLEKYSIDLFSYCWMPNHWQMVLSPRKDGEMGKLLYRVTMTHTARHHAHNQTAEEGHFYQGRFKSFPIQSDEFFTPCAVTLNETP